jgi:SNF2 family DNA or RNA helicase
MINTTTPLLAHQREAVAKLLPTRVGALFMDMGTGKSRTAIELVKLRQEKISRVLWFCPVSLKQTVRHEIRKHTDAADADIHVFNDKTNTRTVPAATWYVIGIESISSSNRVALTANSLIDENTLVIVDESSYIKGHRSMRTQRLTQYAKRGRYRLILTGTPVSQGVVDLFAQMRFLSPKILGYQSYYSFAANHLEYSDKYRGLIVESHNEAWIAAKIRPYVYQVTKDECLTLPDKLYTARYCDLTNEQSEYYALAKEEILERLMDEEITSYVIFQLFTALQQIACGFWNRRTTGYNGETIEQFIELRHNRLDVLLETINSIPPDEKIIIWAKYRYDIEQISTALADEYGSDSIAQFYGDLNERKRADQVERFRSDARFFIATPSCGGHGLTLNEASTVIFYNNGFKYSERIQAEDRCHRIGQTRKVTYIDIWADCGIDERIGNALAHKANVVEAFKAEVDKIKENRKKNVSELIKRL